MNVPSEIGREPSSVARLTADLDVDVCIVGGGLAGLNIAIEIAQRGASVAVLEAGRLCSGASGHHLGTVKPGFDVSLDDLIARVGIRDAGALWRMSSDGAEHVRSLAVTMPEVAMSDGALEVSNVNAGNRLMERLQRLGDFGIDAEGWEVGQVRETLKTRRYFQGLYYRRAFQLDAAAYFRGLRAAAAAAGVRVYEDSPAIGVDASGIRKRILTPFARVRAGHIVLCGNVQLGRAYPRLAATLLPIWRYASITAPLGESLTEAISFPGSVIDADGIDHFKIVGGNRLAWSSPTSTWAGRPEWHARTIRRRIRKVFPQLGNVAVEESWSGVTGHTVHGMPQIAQIQPGLWVASGFGRQGINTSAMAALLVSRGILYRDDSWRLMSSFDLVWAGGRTGRVAGQVVEMSRRGGSEAAGALARLREKAKHRAQAREARFDASRQKGRNLSPASEPLSASSQQSERPADATG